MIQIGWSEDLDFGDFKVTVNILIFRIRQDVRVTHWIGFVLVYLWIQ